MISETEATRCMGFLKRAVDAIESAEVHLAEATLPNAPPSLLSKIAELVEGAADDLVVAGESIFVARVEAARGGKHGATTNRTSAGSTLATGGKTGSH